MQCTYTVLSIRPMTLSSLLTEKGQVASWEKKSSICASLMYKRGTYHAEKAQAIPGTSPLQQRKPVLPPRPGHSDLYSCSALPQPIGVLVLTWHLQTWWMRASRESIGRRTRLWTKRMARAKKGEHRTDGEGGRERNVRHVTKLIFKF